MREQLGLLAELIKLARADQTVRHEEYNFLLNLALLLGVSKAELDTLFEELIECKPPKLENDRILQFHRMILLANVDHHIDKREMAFLRDAGIRMGLNPLTIEQVLQEMQTVENGKLSPEHLIKIFQVNHN